MSNDSLPPTSVDEMVDACLQTARHLHELGATVQITVSGASHGNLDTTLAAIEACRTATEDDARERLGPLLRHQ